MENLNLKTVQELKDIAHSLDIKPIPRVKKDLIAVIEAKHGKRSLKELREFYKRYERVVAFACDDEAMTREDLEIIVSAVPVRSNTNLQTKYTHLEALQ